MKAAFLFSTFTILLLSACATPTVFLDEDGAAVLDRALTDALADSNIPGMVALVTSRDSVLYRRAFGVTGVASTKPMTTDGIFRIHSMTKPITSLALMMLVERGEVEMGLNDGGLDDDQVEDGWVLTCQSRVRSAGARVEYPDAD